MLVIMSGKLEIPLFFCRVYKETNVKWAQLGGGRSTKMGTVAGALGSVSLSLSCLSLSAEDQRSTQNAVRLIPLPLECHSLLPSSPHHTPSMPCRWSWQRDVSNRRCSVGLFPSLLSDTLLIKRYLRLTSVVWRLGLFSWTSTVCDDDSREKEPEIERERERETAYAIQSRELRHWLKCIHSIALRKLGPPRRIKYEWMRVQFAFHDEYDEYCVNCSLEFIIKFVFPANCNAVK